MTVGPGHTLSHYRLLDKIGEGGMGVVWKAEDTVLRRIVAIKVLPARTSRDEDQRQMFLAEARMAASVSDLHIVQVYELGRQEDLDFIVMEYVEGKPLSALIHGRPLPSDTIATFGFQVARALSRAHRKGLLHRDLKPGNILVTPDGDIKVVDFGLATLFTQRDATGFGQRGAARSLEDAETIWTTETRRGEAQADTPPGRGVLLGTIPYMSPEQARSEPLDARSDIFSLGIVLYEMTTGHRPFTGATNMEVLQEILTSRPTPVHERVPKVPLELDRIIQKSMAAQPADRYQTMEDLAVDLKRLGRDLESGSSPSYDELRDAVSRQRQPRIGLVPAVAVVALGVIVLASWYSWSQIDRARRESAVSAAAILILPLEVRGQSDGADYVGRSFAEALAVSLAQSKNIKVLPVAAGSDVVANPAVLSQAATAGAGRLLTGSLVREDRVVHASVSLVDAGQNRILWGTRRDGADTHVAELALSMARELAVEIGGQLPRLYDVPYNAIAGSPISTSATTSAAIGALQRREFQDALEATERLIEQFPGDAEAQALRLQAVFDAWEQDRSAVNRQGLESAWKAMDRIDPMHPSTEVQRAYVQSGDGELTAAIARFSRVLARSDLGLAFRAHVLVLRGWNQSLAGDTNAALSDLQDALRLSPANAAVFTQLANSLRVAGRLPEALTRARQAVLLSPSDPPALMALGWTLNDLGKPQEALDPVSKACARSRGQSQCAAYASLLVQVDRKDEARAAAQAAEALPENPGGLYNLACFWAHLGDRARALHSLRRATELGFVQRSIERDPDLASLHGDPQFEAIVAGVNRRLERARARR
jgi:serine/threonine protein kinase/tetratricopeptide (TPR) repeat protein